MTTTLVYSHAACLEHRPGPGHPESPERLNVVLRALRSPEFSSRTCEGRIVSILEGGYSLEGLATSTAAHVRALMGVEAHQLTIT